MSEEEKMKIAVNLAKQGIDLEAVERIALDIYEYLKPILELAEKNKKIIDKYCKRKDKEDEYNNRKYSDINMRYNNLGCIVNNNNSYK